MTNNETRLDYKKIVELIELGSSVLDLGCGTGDLLYLLKKEKNVRGQGIDVDEQAIYASVAKKLTVSHGDIDTGLQEYKDKSFDYVILNQSLQQLKNVDAVLKDALRAGRKVIIGLPNFAYYKSRFQLFFRGRTPVTDYLPYSWHETPNLHFLSISDFIDYCRLKNIPIEKKIFINDKKQIFLLPNLFASTGLFVLKGRI